MLEEQVVLLNSYLVEHGLDQPFNNAHPLFFNSRKEKLTTADTNHILRKYSNLAKNVNEGLFPDKISCHVFRHSRLYIC